MTARVAGETKKRKQTGVDEKDQGAETEMEPIWKLKRQNDVPPQKGQDHQRKVEKIAVKILQPKRKAGLAAVSFACVAHSAIRGRLEKGAVVSFAVIVTGETKAAGHPEDQKSGG